MAKKISFGNQTKRFLILVLVLLGCWYTGRFFQTEVDYYKSLILKFPLGLSGLVFVLLYSGVTFFAWLTKDLFKIVGAIIFGAYWSTFFIWLAELVNVIVLFNLSRRLGRGFIEEKLKGHSSQLDVLIENSGFWSVFAFRIIPLIPYRFLDLMYGLTRIPFRQYFGIAMIASPLRIFLIQFVLAAVGESILENPSVGQVAAKLMVYFLENRFVLYVGFFYLVAAVVLMLVIKKKSFSRRKIPF